MEDIGKVMTCTFSSLINQIIILLNTRQDGAKKITHGLVTFLVI